jgi:hypothetical protein
LKLLCCKRTLAGLAVILVVGWTAAGQTASIRFEGGIFKVAGWKAPATPPSGGWGSIFSVYAAAGEVPELLGKYSIEQGTLIFRPDFPVAPGVRYRAVFHAAGLPPLEKTFDGPPKETAPRARVFQIYPSADVLPSNQLRLYIYFSEAMSRGVAAQYIHVLDDKGKVLEGMESVFLRSQELWDPAFQRLTMTFDPGRIKRGLTSNQKIGPPIMEGKQYAIVIDRDWPDARGVPMVESFRKPFRGGPAQRTPPDPKQWHVSAPKAGGSDPVVVNFPTSMNYPLLQRMLQVSGPQGKVGGTVSVAREESEWRFTPREAWKPGDYQLIVNTGLEDLAGNHIGQPFDIDTFDRVTERITTETISLPLPIR